jgi:hypothetical protein
MLVMNKIPQLFDWGIFFSDELGVLSDELGVLSDELGVLSDELGVLSDELSVVLCPYLNKITLIRFRH